MKKVLAVDDEWFNREVIEYTLKHWGYDVVVAGDGEEAIEVVNKQHCDLVITDIGMPKINGIQLTKILKLTHPELKVMLMSAAYGKTFKPTALEAGADDFLPKPYDLKDFEQKVKDLIGLAA